MSLIEKNLGEFAELLASGEPVPGGGGGSALVGALGASLASMVGNLTTGKKKYAEYEADIQRILTEAEALRLRLLAQIDEDAQGFEPLSRAYGISKDDPGRAAILEAALDTACVAPLAIMETAGQAIELHAQLAVKGSRLMLSDVGVGILCCKTALMGASLNVLINVKLMQKKARAAELKSRLEGLLEKYCTLADETYSRVFEELK